MRNLILAVGLAVLSAACSAENAAQSAGPETEAASEGAAAPARVSYKTSAKRNFDPAAGRALYVAKGCVICHAVNGVGGKAAPPLDAPIGAGAVDPLDFAARMWLGAPAMIELQSIELGYTIYLTADEIGHLAAFAADREAQKQLTPDALTDELRDSLLDQRFWEMEDWDDYLAGGREGEIPPAEDLPVDE